MPSLDQEVRMRAFAWLDEQQAVHGDVLPWNVLTKKFFFEGERVPLLGPQGIFKSRFTDYPISITTSPESPYDDTFSEDGLLAYRYRGTNPQHRDNVALRRCWTDKVPLIYFHGLVKGRYLATWPVFIVGDSPEELTFQVAVDAADGAGRLAEQMVVGEAASARRAYITAAVRQRLHQRSFRERVISAYHERCALCRLRHRELLDAAHIIADSHPQGIPSVRNGISLCKLHHAAFDSLMVGITPDYTVEIRSDLLEEEDGPMLQHGLKEMHASKLILPSRKEFWPDREALGNRYEQFQRAS
jgi:putative restriction endonuclease